MAGVFRAALLAAPPDGGGGGLADVNLGLTIWTVVLFLLFAFVLTKLGWKPLLTMIEERENGIRQAVRTAEEARAEAQKLLAEHKELLREAGRQREDIVKSALADAEKLRADLSAQARSEAESLLQRARDQIEREKMLALQDIRGRIADLAVEAAGKIVTSSLSPDVQRQLVDEFIQKVPDLKQ
ncbi:MAG TPA: F0F1 ATP synthase subunit B [Vicinamibacteria bacterium]|jgi:F-type H+-transporting ATPase subunit b